MNTIPGSCSDTIPGTTWVCTSSAALLQATRGPWSCGSCYAQKRRKLLWRRLNKWGPTLKWSCHKFTIQEARLKYNIYIYADVGISLAPSFQARPALSGCKWQSNSLKMAAHISAVTRNPLLALLAQYSSKINSIMSRISHDFDFKLSATAFATTPVPCCSKLTQQVDAPRQSFLYAFQL